MESSHGAVGDAVGAVGDAVGTTQIPHVKGHLSLAISKLRHLKGVSLLATHEHDLTPSTGGGMRKRSVESAHPSFIGSPPMASFAQSSPHVSGQEALTSQ